MKKIHGLDGAVILAAGVFYGVNRFFLRQAVSGPLGWFLRCYANDILAGAAILCWLNLLLGAAGLGRVRRWRESIPFLLVCGLVWEYAAPLWKPTAVADPWDLLAYQLGGAAVLLGNRWLERDQ